MTKLSLVSKVRNVFGLPSGGARTTLESKWLTTLRHMEVPVVKTAVTAAKSSLSIKSLVSSTASSEESLIEILSSTSSLASSVERIAKSTTETLGSADSMAGMLSEGVRYSRSSAEVSQSLERQMKLMAEQIGDMTLQMKKIFAVTALIQDIAFQTKLLSFNAAVEAARAGENGAGFHIVAQEVRALAESVSARNLEITALIKTIDQTMTPLQDVIRKNIDLVKVNSEESQKVNTLLSSVQELVTITAGNMQTIARESEENATSVHNIMTSVERAGTLSESIKTDVSHLDKQMSALLSMTEQTYENFASYEGDSLFHCALPASRETARKLRQLFEAKIAAGAFQLKDLLELKYHPISGVQIRDLQRLFDVSKVPESGFEPVKYSTAYDRFVDIEIRTLLDELRACDSRIGFTIAIDLNSYAPSHTSHHCRAWTGDPAKDLTGNRAKRFFLDGRTLVRGARVGFENRASQIQNQASRADFVNAGCDLRRSAEQEQKFLVQTYPRDTGEVATVLTVPVYVLGERWGAIVVGWSPEAAG